MEMPYCKNWPANNNNNDAAAREIGDTRMAIELNNCHIRIINSGSFMCLD